jgi:hypothetical protein
MKQKKKKKNAARPRALSTNSGDLKGDLIDEIKSHNSNQE